MKSKVLLVVIFIFLHGLVWSQTTFFTLNSVWKYKDDGTDQGTAWRDVGFDDSGWLSGPGKLGYRYPAGGPNNVGIVTPVKCGNAPCSTFSTKYITYYFRKQITIPDISIFRSFLFEMYRDDGIVVYINGTEVYKNNMPASPITHTTLALASSSDDGKSVLTVALANAASLLQSGNNTIAVEVHQSSTASPDLVWDMALTGIPIGIPVITRGPYLQKATSATMLVRWYTDIATDSKVMYGTDPGNLSQSVVVPVNNTNHSVQLTGLTPYTKYYYSIGTSINVIQSGEDYHFRTSPLPDAEDKYTFWAIGDVGNNSARQQDVLDQYNNYIGNGITDGWILLGDNAYTNGTNPAYTTNFFEIYQRSIMRKSALWPATGNHEYANSLARQRDHNVPYFEIFDPPSNGEGGGIPSGSEAYYSFDYGNIHFIALDSYIIERISGVDHRLFNTNGPQAKWLVEDLEANTKKWTIVYFHHPPYSMGSHNSDTESELVNLRLNIIPILEQYDVDLVLTGHSHSYERSRLMKGHLGLEATFDPLIHNLSQSSGKYDGTLNSCLYTKDSPATLGGGIHAVVGSSGMLDPGQTGPVYFFPHDALPFANDQIAGSLILEIEGNRLDAKWLATNGNILDKFTIMKNVNKVNNININAGESITMQASWIGQYTWNTGQTSRTISVTPSESVTYSVTDQYGCITDEFNITITPLPVELTSFTANVVDDKIILNWRTASELNNDFFEVHRFTAPEQVKTLGRVRGNGTTAESVNYEFVDFSPIRGMAYYRLKQVDYDGRFEYSNVIRTEYDGGRSVKIFPNPGSGAMLSLHVGLEESPLHIAVLNAQGEKITTFYTDSTFTSGIQELKFDPPLSSGLYFVQIRSNTGIITRKWIVE